MPTDEQVLFQLASGLDYIHSKDIIHRNIRPENILIVLSSSKWVQMKISNFNYAVRYQDLNSKSQMSTNKSEELIYWVSPEEKFLITVTQSTNSYGTPDRIIAPKFRFVHCDTFSCGCVLLYFLLRGIHPFGSNNLVIPTNIARANPVNLKGITQSQ
jgi:serine/threonine protein kinase